MKTKIPSPSRSQGAHTPQRKSRRTLSVGSPALSTASGRLTSVVQGFVNKQMNSFALSPLPKRRSVLTDNTDIVEEPRRKSWWKKLNENSRNVLEILEDNNLVEPNNIMEELDIEILSQEKKNYTLDIPESSDGESIHSIVLPQRKLFTQKESQHQKKFDQIIETRETMTKSNKNMTINDKVVNAGTKELFQNKRRSKLLFPAALLDISPDKTVADKTKEFAAEPKTQLRNIFGNRQGAKRKNMFADFIATESDDEIPEIQPRVFGFPKKLENIRRGSSTSRGIGESSPTSNITTDTEMDEWRLLPSSTMVEHQLEAMMEQNTPKRPRLSKLTETKESSGTNTVFSKSQSPEVNTSVLTRSRLRALNNSRTSTAGEKNKTHEKIDQNQTKKNNRLDQSQNNQSRAKIKEINKNLEHNEDQNLNVSDISQGKMNKSKGKHNRSLQKANMSLVIESEQYDDQNKEVVDGIQAINVAMETSQNQGQIDEEQNQQNEANLENDKQSQEVDESEEVDENEKIIQNNKVKDTEQEGDKDQEDEIRNKENESQEVAEGSDKEELEESQDQINESQEQDDENEEQANESLEKFEESIEQEDEEQAADQSRAETDEINKVDKNDGENEEEIDHTADHINESNEVENDEENEEEIDHTADHINESNEAAGESNKIADQSQEDIKEVDESNQVANESNEAVNQTQEEEVDDESNIEQNESQLATEDDENEDNDHEENIQEEADENNVDQNESQEENENEAVEDENDVENESQLPIDDDEIEAIEHDENTTQEEVDESNVEQNESQEDDGNEAVEDEDAVENENGSENAELHYESASEEMAVDDEPQSDQDDAPIDQENNTNTPEPVDNESNISHDTTGRNRKKHTSPEAILHDETKQANSFAVRRNTSIRKTKSVANLLNDKPSLMPARDSVGFSDGTTNSSAEGSGWDSHRTTRKTIRQTFGRDATPRKSLRALVMEKSAKRNTLASQTAKFPLANSTAVPEISLGYLDTQPIHQESTHEVSLRTRQVTLDAVLEKIKEDNLKKRAEIEESVKKSLETHSDDHIFKVPLRPMFPRRRANQENKTSKVKPIWRGLPDEMIKDLQYKPPKRFMPSNAPWITKRLYKYLETKLEPKYDYKARVRAEKLVETVYNYTKDMRRQPVASEDATNVLKHEMARLKIVRTHHDFYEFFRQFMPREVRIKVIPDVVNKIPLPRPDVFSDIIVTDSAQG